MSEVKDIEGRVKAIIAEQFCKDVGEIDLADDLAEKHGCDSLDQVEIVMNLEDDFDIDIPDEEMYAVKTVHQAVDLVRKKVAT
jgi:acyl carrier protein